MENEIADSQLSIAKFAILSRINAMYLKHHNFKKK